MIIFINIIKDYIRCWHCGYWRKIGPIDPFIGDDEDDD